MTNKVGHNGDWETCAHADCVAYRNEPRLVDARRHFVNDGAGGGNFVDNRHFAGLVVGELVTHDVAAPGTGHVTYRIVRVDERGAWGVVVESTARDLTIGEVR